MGRGGGIIKRVKQRSIYTIFCMIFLVVAAIPISSAVGDQNTNGKNSVTNLQVGVSSEELQQTQTVLQNNQPFGKNTNRILGSGNTRGNINLNDSLKLGDTGDEVKELQQWLTDYGYYSGSIDGVFGSDTESAVKTFQEEAGIIVDGVVGKDTKNTMKTWDRYVAEAEAAAGETGYSSDTSGSSGHTSDASIASSSKKSYAHAVRSYTKSYGYSNSWNRGKGVGDCWANSAALYSQLSSSGQRARIVQYANGYVSNHRSVQIWNGGGWVDYDYKGNGYAQRYYAQPALSSHGTVIVSN